MDENQNFYLIGSVFTEEIASQTTYKTVKKEIICLKIDVENELLWSKEIQRSISSTSQVEKDLQVVMSNNEIHVLYDSSKKISTDGLGNLSYEASEIGSFDIDVNGNLAQNQLQIGSGESTKKSCGLKIIECNDHFQFVNNFSKMKIVLPTILFFVAAVGGFAYTPLYVAAIPAFIMYFTEYATKERSCVGLVNYNKDL